MVTEFERQQVNINKMVQQKVSAQQGGSSMFGTGPNPFAVP